MYLTTSRPEETERELLIQRLKAARLRRCHMLFDLLSPDFNDTLYISGAVTILFICIHNMLKSEHFKHLHPDSVVSLQAFFKAFYQSNR